MSYITELESQAHNKDVLVARLYIECENLAFKPNAKDELISILRTLADRLEKGAMDHAPTLPLKVRDINGNYVGDFSISYEPRIVY